jgi:hypothetical protein
MCKPETDVVGKTVHRESKCIFISNIGKDMSRKGASMSLIRDDEQHHGKLMQTMADPMINIVDRPNNNR